MSANGYKNYDTYKMTMYITNVKSNYFTVKKKKKDLLKMSDGQFINFLQKLNTIGDTLNYKVMCIKEIRQFIEKIN